MKASPTHFAIFKDQEREETRLEWADPNYCTVQGVPTVAGMDKRYGPQNIFFLPGYDAAVWDVFVRHTYDEFIDKDVAWEDYKAAVDRLLERGGRLVRTLEVWDPTDVRWDDDGEEDFWILPVSCENWEPFP